MALEDLTGTKYIDALVATNPVVADDFDEGVDHIQGMKNVLLTTFPNIDGAVTATPAQLNALVPRRNRLINGSFVIGQRIKSITGLVANDFPADMWQMIFSTTAVQDSDIVQEYTSGVPFSSYLETDVTTADVSILSTAICGMIQKIEGPNVAGFELGTAAAKNFTVSFWHKHTVAGEQSFSLRNSANDRSYVATYTQSVSDTWEYSETTIAGDTSGTWTTDEATIGLNLHFAIGVGSNFLKAAGSWGAGNYLGSSSTVNNLETIGNKMRFANVQIESGDVATDFEHRNFPEELALCQRHYEESYNYDVAADSNSLMGMETHYMTDMAVAVHTCGSKAAFKVTKMGIPTIKVYDPYGSSGDLYAYDWEAVASVACAASTIGMQGFRWIVTGASSDTFNVGVQWTATSKL